MIGAEDAKQPIIREAIRDDAAVIHDLLEPEVRQRKLLRRSRDEIADLTRHGFLAEIEGQCVGFAAVEIYNRKLAEVQSLVVRDEHRMHGIGRELVLRCVDRAREMGVMEVMAISSSEEFLRGCGFDYALPDQKKAMFCQLRSRHDDRAS